MPKNFEVNGPAFIGLLVRDAEASAAFYEKKLGLRRDPEAFPPGAIAFLTRPIPFGLIQPPPGVDLASISRPILSPAVWFKTANSQAVHKALVEDGVTILKAPSNGRFGWHIPVVDRDGYAITIYDRDMPEAGWEQNS